LDNKSSDIENLSRKLNILISKQEKLNQLKSKNQAYPIHRSLEKKNRSIRPGYR
jgi:hypothetical protein